MSSLEVMKNQFSWNQFASRYHYYPTLQLALDGSRMEVNDGALQELVPKLNQALEAMDALEKGAIANPDEKRMVGHYWLRDADRAPEPDLTQAIRDCEEAISRFVAAVHGGSLQGAKGSFRHFLVVGIGGSALGPQFVAQALGRPGLDKMRPWFFDNTDPDGMDRVLEELGSELGRTLVVVISKSGGTKETRNGMLEAQRAYQAAGLDFAKHAVAVTGEGSQLDQVAVQEGWLARFPMWDWVGGRTSETSAVGLLPAALQGLDTARFLAGAKACDEVTRQRDALTNPASLMAAYWYLIGEGRGKKDLVVLPYKDSLALFSKYLQQLIMESLGKELDRQGQVVHQGIAVYGNKGSTDQHAYVQQLREGVPNFFVTFIEVLRDRVAEASMEVEPGVTTGDYLNGFFQGTRDALSEKNRSSITLTIEDVTPEAIGALIALYERAVGLYAELIDINAYHQPGVEAGKKAAGQVIELQSTLMEWFRSHPEGGTALEVANALNRPEAAESIFKICEHLAGNPSRGIRRSGDPLPATCRYHLA